MFKVWPIRWTGGKNTKWWSSPAKKQQQRAFARWITLLTEKRKKQSFVFEGIAYNVWTLCLKTICGVAMEEGTWLNCHEILKQASQLGVGVKMPRAASLRIGCRNRKRHFHAHFSARGHVTEDILPEKSTLTTTYYVKKKEKKRKKKKKLLSKCCSLSVIA